MSFLYASMLAGLTGLLAPFIIHLIARHKFPVQDFPAIHLLRFERRDNAFARRLVDPLQLLLRLLVIALLVLAMARLFSPALSSEPAPRNLVVVIDTSASMLAKAEAAEDDETTPLARAKVVARTLLKDIALPSRCALITAGDRTELAAAMSPDPQPAINLVDDLKADDGTGPGLIDAVAQAVRMVRGRREVKSQIVVLTDRGESAFETRNQNDLKSVEEAENQMGEQLDIVIVDVGSGQAENVAIIGGELRGREARIGDDAHVLARVRNFGKEKQSTRVALSVPGLQEAPIRDLTLEPDEEVLIDLAPNVRRSVRTFAQITLTAKDAIEKDNKFGVPFVVAPSRRVLLINGAAEGGGSVSVESAQLVRLGGGSEEGIEEVVDGARILQYALNPGRELGLAFGTGIDTEQITLETLPAKILSRYDTIILYDVTSLTDQALEDIDIFVREGRSLLILCSATLNPVEFNDSLARKGKDGKPGLSPARIGNDLTLEPPVTVDLTGHDDLGLGEGVTRSPGPWLTPFRDVRRSDLSAIRFRKIREVIDIEHGANVLMMSGGGHVLAVEAKRDLGRVVLLAFGAELGRGNIAMTKAFPQLTWRLVDYLTGRLRNKPPDSLLAATDSVLDVSEPTFSFVNSLELAEIRVGQLKMEKQQLDVSDRKTVLVEGLRTGNYMLQKPRKSGIGFGGGYMRPITVNHDPRESRTGRITESEVQTLLGSDARVVKAGDVPGLVPFGGEAFRLIVFGLIFFYLAEALSAYLLGVRRDRLAEEEHAANE